MANWLEVEAKVKIDDDDIENLRKKVKEIANLRKSDFREDDYFALQKGKYPKKAFRIRFDGKKYVVNFKKPLKEFSKSAVVVKKEYEFELNDVEHIDNFLALLKDFGFREWVKKNKQTESYFLKKDKRVTIELSRVEHLGNFMEVECLVRTKQINEARKKVYDVLRILGVEKKVDNTGYTKILWRKGFKI